MLIYIHPCHSSGWSVWCTSWHQSVGRFDVSLQHSVPRPNLTTSLATSSTFTFDSEQRATPSLMLAPDGEGRCTMKHYFPVLWEDSKALENRHELSKLTCKPHSMLHSRNCWSKWDLNSLLQLKRPPKHAICFTWMLLLAEHCQ